MATASTEDYLERIYELIEQKGYARVVDLAERLEVKPPSVTKMIQNLDEQGFVKYEKYRGVTLTLKGEKIAKTIKGRHLMLEEFFRLLGISDAIMQEDIEGIEHHLSPTTLGKLSDLVHYFNSNPELVSNFREFRRHNPKV